MNTRFSFTVTLYTYNQEAHVRQAVESILAQECAPMEIIISDDASTDRTYDIVRECVEAYTGPHKVILNRNEKNRGFRRHVNEIISRTSGDWVIYAAGDDVFFPNRCAEIMKAVDKYPEALAVTSEWIDINDAGEEQKPYRPLADAEYTVWTIQNILKGKTVWANGCAAAYSRTVLDMTPMPPGVRTDDFFYSLLAFLKGSIVRINKRLLLFRSWNGSMTNQPSQSSDFAYAKKVYQQRARTKRIQKVVYLQCLKYAEKMPTSALPQKEQIVRELKRRVYKAKALSVWWRLSLSQKAALVLKLSRSPLYLLSLDAYTALSLKKERKKNGKKGA